MTHAESKSLIRSSGSSPGMASLERSLTYIPVKLPEGCWPIDSQESVSMLPEFAELIALASREVKRLSAEISQAPESALIHVLKISDAPNFHFDLGKRTLVIGLLNAPTVIAQGARPMSSEIAGAAHIPLGDQTVPADVTSCEFEVVKDREPLVLDGLKQGMPLAHSPPWRSMFDDSARKLLCVVTIAHWA